MKKIFFFTFLTAISGSLSLQGFSLAKLFSSNKDKKNQYPEEIAYVEEKENTCLKCQDKGPFGKKNKKK